MANTLRLRLEWQVHFYSPIIHYHTKSLLHVLFCSSRESSHWKTIPGFLPSAYRTAAVQIRRRGPEETPESRKISPEWPTVDERWRDGEKCCWFTEHHKEFSLSLVAVTYISSSYLHSYAPGRNDINVRSHSCPAERVSLSVRIIWSLKLWNGVESFVIGRAVVKAPFETGEKVCVCLPLQVLLLSLLHRSQQNDHTNLHLSVHAFSSINIPGQSCLQLSSGTLNLMFIIPGGPEHRTVSTTPHPTQSSSVINNQSRCFETRNTWNYAVQMVTQAWIKGIVWPNPTTTIFHMFHSLVIWLRNWVNIVFKH